MCVCDSSDSSQSDTNTKDFWLNMPALTAYLRKSSEQNPAASYYNVDILKYQVCSFSFSYIWDSTLLAHELLKKLK